MSFKHIMKNTLEIVGGSTVFILALVAERKLKNKKEQKHNEEKIKVDTPTVTRDEVIDVIKDNINRPDQEINSGKMILSDDDKTNDDLTQDDQSKDESKSDKSKDDKSEKDKTKDDKLKSDKKVSKAKKSKTNKNK